MAPKNVLVVTTSSVDGLKVEKYLKPVSAHVVAGTNLFSDFYAGLTDIFGGRSETYQNQLTSLYNEAIDRVKHAAFEIGANCILGLKIDMDEISGKGKAMFMVTAVGTAVILEEKVFDNNALSNNDEILENVSVERINMLRRKKEIIEKARKETLILNKEIWNFITANRIDEVFPFLLKSFQDTSGNEQISFGSTDEFYKLIVDYIDMLPEEKKLTILYDCISDQSEKVATVFSKIINKLYLFDFNRIMDLLKSDNFEIQKRGIRITSYDKPFYNKQDIKDFQTIQKYIQETFKERGKRTTKKQLLSSKETEVWLCECGRTNDIETHCYECGQDIYGFTQYELKPTTADKYIGQKIELISEYVKEQAPSETL